MSHVFGNFFQTLKHAILYVVAFVILAPLAILIGIPWLIYGALKGVFLKYKFRSIYHGQEKFLILATSDSPKWNDYIATHWIPTLAPHGVVLNISNRAQWHAHEPLEAKIWKHWIGDKNHTPAVIFIAHKGPVEVINFYKQFLERKRSGNTTPLTQQEEILFTRFKELKRSI